VRDEGDRPILRRGRRLFDPHLARVRVQQTEVCESPPDVDTKLLRVVKDAGGSIVTVDSNLTKVARVQDLGALNLNEIAAAMRPAYLPGESLRLTIVKEGKEAEQGVGYLEDGTMVVVAEGRHHIGKETDAVVTSVLQTAVGRMVFARVAS
jgi:uncharacterized protein YacL